jgi:hypothetical protein
MYILHLMRQLKQEMNIFLPHREVPQNEKSALTQRGAIQMRGGQTPGRHGYLTAIFPRRESILSRVETNFRLPH